MAQPVLKNEHDHSQLVLLYLTTWKICYFKHFSYQYECQFQQSFQCCWAPSEERLFASPQRDTLPPMSECQWLWTPTGKTHKAKKISPSIHFLQTEKFQTYYSANKKCTLMASMAYSTWKSLPSGEKVFTPLRMKKDVNMI